MISRNILKATVALFFLCLLIGRNLPFDWLFLYGLGPWDFFAIFLFPFLSYEFIPKKIVICLFVFFLTAILGLLVGYQHGFKIVDLFEILRVFYSFELIVIGILFGKYLNKDSIIYILFISSIIVFLFSYMYPMNPDVLGFVQIWNPNVVGNYITHSFIVILVLSGKLNLRVISLIFILLIASFFTYSKASWIMIFLTFVVTFVNLNRLYKFIVLIILAVLIGYNSEGITAISTLVNAKITASGFEGSAASGSSVGARLGLAYSGFLMFLKSPIFGIGIGNFEVLNDALKSTLGNMYYRDDNANSLFFHYLGTTGLIGLCAVILLIYEYFRLLMVFVKSKTIYILTLIFFIITINFQRELFTTNTMYLLIGILTFKTKRGDEGSDFNSIN